ncbi:ATP-binding protein [Lysinibacillus xylanilyticus]|uniref:hypothetical protein n=1 Tax=Lysinibacillus xylanilyticus TaxID=582475 RepID=UPI0036DEDC7F
MEIEFYNIQGFRGHYKYSIDDAVTIINSKHNGVGKTTLYDCLKFLCDADQVDKEEQEFFLNLNENEGLFSASRDGVKYGFIFYTGKPVIFFRQFDEEEPEYSSENFPTASQDVGVLVVNGAILNIFSKEVNLFSGSHAGKNYQLVAELTTHQETEAMLELIQRSIDINQSDLSNLPAEKRGLDLQVESLPYYLYVDELEDLLNNDFYENLETVLEGALEKAEKLGEVPVLDFNSSIEEFVTLEDVLSRMQPTDFIVPNVEVLEYVDEMSEMVERLQPVELFDLKAEPLELLISLSETLDKLVPQTAVGSLETQPLEVMDSLLTQLDKLQDDYRVEVSSQLPMMLSELCVKLGQMNTSLNQEITFNKLASDNRAILGNTKVNCPIRQEVYLIDGKCVY